MERLESAHWDLVETLSSVLIPPALFAPFSKLRSKRVLPTQAERESAIILGICSCLA